MFAPHKFKLFFTAKEKLEGRLKQIEIRRKVLERASPDLKSSVEEYTRRLSALQASPKSRINAVINANTQLNNRQVNLAQIPVAKLKISNKRKALIVKALLARAKEKEEKNNSAIANLKKRQNAVSEYPDKLYKQQSALEEKQLFEKNWQAWHKQTQRILTNISDPFVFDEYVRRVSLDFYEFFNRKQIKLALNEGKTTREIRSIFGGSSTIEGPIALSSTRAIAAIFGQLARQSGRVPLKNFPQRLPALLKKYGIKRILEIGPGNRGVIDLLIESGIAKEAGLEISAIDRYIEKKRLIELRKKKVNIVRGNALNLSTQLPGKQFDLIFAVGVLGIGGQYGQHFKNNVIGYSANSHNIARNAINALSSNKNALFCVAPILGITTLRRRAVERFAQVTQWSQLSEENKEYGKDAIFSNKPKVPEPNFDTRYEYIEALQEEDEWKKRNATLYNYAKKMLKGAPSLVLLKKK